MQRSQSIKVPCAHFITMGCAKNEVDTRDMQSRLIEGGIAISSNLSDSDIVIVNTCSFIQAAIEESIDAILDVANDDYVISNNIPIVIAGCMASRYGDDLESEFTEAASFVPCSKEDDILDVVLDCLGISSNELMSNQNDSSSKKTAVEKFAYVKISDGCDRFCSYCTIPYIRGRYYSYSLQEIRKNIDVLVDRGVSEIVLIGQDTGLWGQDLGDGHNLAELLSLLAEAYPQILFRFMYTQPENVTDELLETVSSYSNIASYLDIPFQHCSTHVLEDMNRTGSSDEFLSLLEKARDIVPGIAIRTTLMVGFPGETEEDFDELQHFVEEAEFDYIGIFSYSQEDGTKAAMLPDQIAQVDKEDRLSRLRDLADSVSNSVIAKRIGTKVKILIEGAEEDGQLVGRSQYQAPDVDGITFIDRGSPGERVMAIIEDTLFYDMEATMI